MPGMSMRQDGDSFCTGRSCPGKRDSDGRQPAAPGRTRPRGTRLRRERRDPTAPRRLAVVTADVDDAVPDEILGRDEVQLAEPVHIERVASLYVDAGDAEETVRAATEAYDAAGHGDEDAMIAVEEPEGFELLWYATQELPDLLHT